MDNPPILLINLHRSECKAPSLECKDCTNCVTGIIKREQSSLDLGSCVCKFVIDSASINEQIDTLIQQIQVIPSLHAIL